VSSYNVAAAIAVVVGLTCGTAYREHRRPWLLLPMAAMLMVNVLTTPYLLGRLAYSIGVIWLALIYLRSRTQGANAQ